MLQMDGGDGQTHHGAEMELKLTEVRGVTEGHHTRVVRTRTELREDHLALFGEEELHAPDTGTCQGLRHLVGHHLGLFQGLVADLIRLP